MSTVVAVHGVPKNILDFVYFFDNNIFWRLTQFKVESQINVMWASEDY